MQEDVKVSEHDQGNNVVHDQLAADVHVPLSVELWVYCYLHYFGGEVEQRADDVSKDGTCELPSYHQDQYCTIYQWEHKNGGNKELVSLFESSVSTEHY